MSEHKIKEEQKKKAFEENPDRFVNTEDCLMIVKRNEEGQIAVMNLVTKIQDIVDMKYWIGFRLDERAFQIQMAKAKNPVIAKPVMVDSNGKPIPLR